MKYKTHLAGGLLAGALIIKASPEIDIYSTQTMGIIALTTFGSLLPDIDHKGSYLGRRVRPISSVVSAIAKHRGITHTPIAAFMISVMLFMLSKVAGFVVPNIYFVSLFAGIMSHILLDSLTKGGVPLFAPISSKMISFTSFKTGSMFEQFVLVGLFIINIYILKGFII